MKLHDVARIGYEVVRALESVNGSNVPAWIDATQEERESVYIRASEIRGGLTTEEIHNRIVSEKLSQGWKQGRTFNAKRKTSPELVPYEKLPASTKAADAAFASVVSLLLPYLNTSDGCYFDNGDGNLIVGVVPRLSLLAGVVR